MLAILKREIKNYIKRPLFWIGIAIVTLGVFQAVKPYLSIRYLSPGEEDRRIFHLGFSNESGGGGIHYK